MEAPGRDIQPALLGPRQVSSRGMTPIPQTLVHLASAAAGLASAGFAVVAAVAVIIRSLYRQWPGVVWPLVALALAVLMAVLTAVLST